MMMYLSIECFQKIIELNHNLIKTKTKTKTKNKKQD
jgi:hypothetical protein